MKKLAQLSGFYTFLLFEKFLMLLPRFLRRSFFIGLGHFAYMMPNRYKKVVMQNLRFIYGDKISDLEIQEITRYQYKLLMLNFMYTLEGRYYSVIQIQKQIRFKNEEIVKAIQKEGRPIVFITAHYGAWELGGSMLSALIEPVLIVYKKMKNPYFQDYLLGSRAKFNIKYVERHGATRGILKQLRQNGAIALLIDTNISKKDGTPTEFLGKEISQIKTTAYFARKFDAALVPLLIHTKDDKEYEIEFYEEILYPKTEDEEADIKKSVQMQTDWLTQEIYKEPKPWFWLHRRFKGDHPEIYTK